MVSQSPAPTTLEVVAVTDDSGAVVAPMWLSRAERVHRQLRTGLPGDYVEKMKNVFGTGGRMCTAVEGDAVSGIAVFRIHENTHDGRLLYIDDLVTDETRRSRGVGRALLAWLAAYGAVRGCDSLSLDSGTQRTRAHAFYLRESLPITSFHFSRRLR